MKLTINSNLRYIVVVVVETISFLFLWLFCIYNLKRSYRCVAMAPFYGTIPCVIDWSTAGEKRTKRQTFEYFITKLSNIRSYKKQTNKQSIVAGDLTSIWLYNHDNVIRFSAFCPTYLSTLFILLNNRIKYEYNFAIEIFHKLITVDRQQKKLCDENVVANSIW